jgi:carbon-monoxide dehydrogenase large subunit
VAGTQTAVSLATIGHVAWTGQGYPHEFGIGLEETEFYQPRQMSAPYGVHIAVVGVDPETGELSILRYLAVDDCGVIINPLLARGQVHGGIAQGIEQALYEDAWCDTTG